MNEILSISPPGKQPSYDAAGNLVRIPSDNLSTGLNWETFTTPEWDAFTTPEWSDFESDRFEIGQTFTYDAWNRLVSVSDDGDLIQTNQYDGRNFRVVRETTAAASTGAETRHCYFSAGWQSLEERLGASSNPERQYVWGQQYIDDCILRDRDTDANGTLDERFYPTQDANWNVTALVDISGGVQERYAYSAYGVPVFLDASYGSRASSSYEWETLFDGYRYDPALEMFHVRYRTYNPTLGVWVQREPLAYYDGMNLYSAYFVPGATDPLGLFCQMEGPCEPGEFRVKGVTDWRLVPATRDFGPGTEELAVEALEGINDYQDFLTLLEEVGIETFGVGALPDNIENPEKLKKLVQEMAKNKSGFYIWMKVDCEECTKRILRDARFEDTDSRWHPCYVRPVGPDVATYIGYSLSGLRRPPGAANKMGFDLKTELDRIKKAFDECKRSILSMSPKKACQKNTRISKDGFSPKVSRPPQPRRSRR